jgi:hypothetical protein
VSFYIEKAFDRSGHTVNIQALRAFIIPERIILSLTSLTLVGFARVGQWETRYPNKNLNRFRPG